MSRRPTLLSQVIWSRFPWRLLILLTSFLAAVAGLAAPWFQKEFVDRLMGVSSPWRLSWFDGPEAWIILSFVCLLLAQGFSQLTSFMGAREALILQNRFARQLYRKMMELRADTMARRSLGEVVSLYATDVPGSTVFLDQTLPMGASTLFPLILAPFALHYLFDVPLLVVLGVIAFVIMVNTALAFRQSRFFYRFKQLAAERVGLVNEWVQNIRTLRILGWVERFEGRIFSTREVETDNRVRMVTNGQVMNSISTSVTFVLNIAALGVLTLTSTRSLTPGEILALLWILAVFLTRPFRQMPWFFTFGFDAWTSLRRLQGFIDTPNNETSTAGVSRLDRTDPSAALEVEGLRLEVGGHTLLDDLSFRLGSGEFVAVVGEVGSGKSLLLLSLLRETGARFHRYALDGRDALAMDNQEIRSHFAFVPQEGFIMSATLRDNVAFEYETTPLDDPRVLHSLGKAEFSLNEERVESGLAAEIGERGVNLSGGQRQRVSLARVHFAGSKILLLDDCLSAVDVDTEEKLVRGLLRGDWRHGTRLLVTHRLSVLPHVDRILFLKEGRIAAQGTFTELLMNPEFAEFTASLEKKTATAKEVGYELN